MSHDPRSRLVEGRKRRLRAPGALIAVLVLLLWPPGLPDPEPSDFYAMLRAHQQEEPSGMLTIGRTRGLIHEGRKEGVWVRAHADGSIARAVQYSADTPTGTWMCWHPNGSRALVGSYDMGARTGIWRAWRADGTREWERTYDARGQVTLLREWDECGDSLE